MSAAFDNGSLAAARAFVPSDAAPPLVKIAALLATGYAVHRSLSPPNPPPAPKTCIDNRTLFERAIRHVTFCTKVSVQFGVGVLLRNTNTPGGRSRGRATASPVKLLCVRPWANCKRHGTCGSRLASRATGQLAADRCATLRPFYVLIRAGEFWTSGGIAG